MSGARSASGEVLRGASRVFIAEAISLPTALITSGYLARHFGPGDYGVLTLTTAIVAWLEWTLVSLFSRASVKLVADAEDWRPAGAVVLRMFAVTGLVGLIGLWLGAPLLAALLAEPSLTRFLRLLALDVPIFMLTQGHQQILVGTGAYGQRATIAAWRWLGRMVLIVGLVAAGFGIVGALLGLVGASAAELVVARWFVRPSLRAATGEHVRAMWGYALPLVVAAVCMRLFDRLDLFTLKSFGASAALAGMYGAAQNLTVVPGLVALSVTTLLLSTLSRAQRRGDTQGTRGLVENALRGVLLLFPFAGVTAGAATGIATLIFGARFAGTGPLLARLIFGAIGIVVVAVASSLVTAAGRASWAMWMSVPLAPLALLGYWIVVPGYGAPGVAAVTMVVGMIGGALGVLGVRGAWGIWPPLGTAARVVVVTAFAVVAGGRWTTSGAMVIVEVVTMSVAAILMLIALGERVPPGLGGRSASWLTSRPS